MTLNKRKNNSKKITITFLLGVLAGAASIFLSNKDNREEVKNKYKESKDKIIDDTYDFIDDISYNIENFDKDEFIQKTKENLEKINKQLDKEKAQIKGQALKKTQISLKKANKKIDALQKMIQKKADNIS